MFSAIFHPNYYLLTKIIEIKQTNLKGDRCVKHSTYRLIYLSLLTTDLHGKFQKTNNFLIELIEFKSIFILIEFKSKNRGHYSYLQNKNKFITYELPPQHTNKSMASIDLFRSPLPMILGLNCLSLFSNYLRLHSTLASK